MGYTPNIDAMLFALKHNARLSQLLWSGYDTNDAKAVLSEAARFASEVLDPLNRTGDVVGCKWQKGHVTTPPGFVDAWRQYSAGGWIGLPFPESFGGQALPKALSVATLEMWNAANMAFALCSLGNDGAAKALLLRGTSEQKRIVVPRLISGAWTGTMNLTEPHAGSDLSRIITRAQRTSNNYFLIRGQKIFITWGEHDLAENIVHLVLARIDGAPPGVKGLSLFLVPKYLFDAKGRLGEHNDLVCAGIEHKLGIHGSPTATMSYGPQSGAIGYLVGEENRGLEAMFIMMNAARLDAGLQGIAQADRAFQLAAAYAAQRVQSTHPDFPKGPAVTIEKLPDVRRMLDTMECHIAAMRALAYFCAGQIDRGHRSHDAVARASFLTPIVKAWCTEVGLKTVSMGIQIHGGMGFIEATGAAQIYRDARIITIWEGTTGIQANDLLFRKILRDNGQVLEIFLQEAQRCVLRGLAADAEECFAAERLNAAIASLRHALNLVVAGEFSTCAPRYAVAVALLMTISPVLAAWQLLTSVQQAQDTGDADASLTQRTKYLTARFAAYGLPSVAAGVAEFEASLALPASDSLPDQVAVSTAMLF